MFFDFTLIFKYINNLSNYKCFTKQLMNTDTNKKKIVINRLRVKKRIIYIKNHIKSHIYHCYRDH